MDIVIRRKLVLRRLGTKNKMLLPQTNHSLATSRPNSRSQELATDFSRFLEKSNSKKPLEPYARFQVRYR